MYGPPILTDRNRSTVPTFHCSTVPPFHRSTVLDSPSAWRTAREPSARLMGNLIRWNGGTVERWNGGTVGRWNGGTVERWNGGTVERWNGGTITIGENRRSTHRPIRLSRLLQPIHAAPITARNAANGRPPHYSSAHVYIQGSS